MNEERRRQLNIPIHKEDKEHQFVDGYCVCGASRRPARKARGYAKSRETRGRSNLDVIEGNSYNR